MVEGLDQVFKNLDSFKAKVEAKQKVALMLAANQYQNDVKRIAPYRKGALRRSIHVEMQDNDTTAIIGTNLPYARRLEYGFVGKDKLGRYYNQAAQPYFRPPLENKRKRYVNTFTEVMTK